MARILIMASDGFEQSELFTPLEKLKEAGHDVHIAAPKAGTIKAWDKDDWGKTVEADLAIADQSPDGFDALVLPGGVINPDNLRVDDKAVSLIKGFAAAGKPVAAICHAPWLLVEAGLVQGRRMTSFKSIRSDIRNAGAELVDQSVVEDRGVITSRNPDDLDDFVAAIEKAIA